MRSTKNTAIKIAEALVCVARDQGQSVDPLKLQKLLYFAQAISLVRNNKLLFKDSVGAWTHGPVVRSVYKKYQDYGRGAITCDKRVEELGLSKKDIAVLEDTLETFKRYTGTQLRNMTHKHLPWKEVFQEGRNVAIKSKRMQGYYLGVFA